MSYGIWGKGLGANRSFYKEPYKIEAGLKSLEEAREMIEELITEYVFSRMAPFYLSLDGKREGLIDENDWFYEKPGAVCTFERVLDKPEAYLVRYEDPPGEPWFATLRIESRDSFCYWNIWIVGQGEKRPYYGYRLSIGEEIGPYESPAWYRRGLRPGYRFGFPRPLEADKENSDELSDMGEKPRERLERREPNPNYPG